MSDAAAESLIFRLRRAFGADDTRTFAVAAVDDAGNESPRTETLVGVPNLIGLKIPEAASALEARGLVIGPQTQGFAAARSAIVVAQTPLSPALAPSGSSIAVVLAAQDAPPAGEPLLLQVTSGRDVSCTPNARLSLKIRLSAAASLTLHFLTASGEPLGVRTVGSLRSGATSLEFLLPPALSRPGRYRVVVAAIAKDEVARADVHVWTSRTERGGSSTCRSR